MNRGPCYCRTQYCCTHMAGVRADLIRTCTKPSNLWPITLNNNTTARRAARGRPPLIIEIIFIGASDTSQCSHTCLLKSHLWHCEPIFSALTVRPHTNWMDIRLCLCMRRSPINFSFDALLCVLRTCLIYKNVYSQLCALQKTPANKWMNTQQASPLLTDILRRVLLFFCWRVYFSVCRTVWSAGWLPLEHVWACFD